MNAREQKLAQLAKEVELAAAALGDRRVEEAYTKRAVVTAQKTLEDRLCELTKYAIQEPAKEEVKS